MTYNIENVAADYIGYIKQIQKYIKHERHAMKIAKALELRVRMGRYNYAIPEAQPPVIITQPWFYGYDSDVLYHELGHVMMWWSGLEEQIRAEYGDEAGWQLVENLCTQAIVFLRLPQPIVDEAVRVHGISAVTVQELAKIGQVSISDALRRLVYDEPMAQRAGFIMQGHKDGYYVREVALCNLGLPFGWLDFVPTIQTLFPTDAIVSFAKISRNRLLGVCGEA